MMLMEKGLEEDDLILRIRRKLICKKISRFWISNCNLTTINLIKSFQSISLSIGAAKQLRLEIVQRTFQILFQIAFIEHNSPLSN